MNKILSQLQPVNHQLFYKHNISVMIKRDDLIHPVISGNKWRKLKYNLLQAKAENKNTILSFGGAFSNHIHALAYACNVQDLNSIGIIRGEPEYANNFTLRWSKHWGMDLNFVDRKTYKQRDNPDYIDQLSIQYPNAYIVPEGGSNELALPGMGEVITEINEQADFDYLLTPVGSGGTLAGLVKADNNKHKLLGISVLKQQGYLDDEVNKLLESDDNRFKNWQILNDFHRGGYAKYKKEDAKRIYQFSQQTGIPFEPVYSGKMLLAFLDLLEQGYFPEKSKIVLLHTGGLQGLGGMHERGLLNDHDWPIPQRAPV
ncbi:1-aminocyclopropane-1-carboxylate deaminase/D-cysteine desulfhydrase [Thalassotalea crassostreae]|uniref:1-aminocyclopropane-1-carboxylate deaminase/D-cysteine desulfhydrase n=1 Tax=Thalassotalea crassostreae TaxID=1763536 RepID=UPI00083881E2|nr:pyridoxal-phosphate dependent enzyme [Thalassotalea crassostreae]